MACIPPMLDPLGTGIPLCPDGYTYNPATNECCPNVAPPVNTGDPTIRQTITAFGDQEFDPAQYFKVGMQGVRDSNILTVFITGLLRLPIRLLSVMIAEAASLFDTVLAALGDAFLAAQGEHASGYYALAATLMTDLVGVEVDGQKLWKDFTTGGRQSAMIALGSALFDVMAGEFAGTVQGDSGGVFTVQAGTGIGGLPAVALSPEQGVKGAKAFLGYVSSYAIREGNTDMLASILPHGVGDIFKDFAEDFSKNLGLGRMGRLVWKPLVSTMVATPMQQALNQQYTPTLLDTEGAYRAWVTGDFSSEQLTAELRLHGYNQTRGGALQWQHLKGPDHAQLRVLHATGAMQDSDYELWHRRAGHTPEVYGLIDQSEDLDIVRSVAVSTAKHFAEQYLLGKMTSVQLGNAIDSISKTVNATPLLTPGEIAALKSLPAISFAAPRRHISLVKLYATYEEGLITLDEFSQGALALGYSPDDVTLLEQDLLVASKKAADRAAKAARTINSGKLAKLTVAQMKTAFESGLLDLADIEAELTTRGYPPNAVNTLANEFRQAAGLLPKTPPTA